MNDGIHFGEFLDYIEEENQRWKKFFGRHPEALDLPLDIAGDVRALVLHIFAVELYFANKVSGQPVIDLHKLPAESLDEIFAISGLAGRMYFRHSPRQRLVSIGGIRPNQSKRQQEETGCPGVYS